VEVTDGHGDFANRGLEAIDNLMNRPGLSDEELESLDDLKSDIVFGLQQEVIDIVSYNRHNPFTLEDAAERFLTIRTIAEDTNDGSDLAKETLGVLAEAVVKAAADQPRSECPSCGLVRSLARSFASLKDRMIEMLEDETSKFFDSDEFESLLNTIEYENAVLISDAVEAHRGDH
jgi:hypothetical protein